MSSIFYQKLPLSILLSNKKELDYVQLLSYRCIAAK